MQGPPPRSRNNSRLFFVYFVPWYAERMLAGGRLKHAETYATIDNDSVYSGITKIGKRFCRSLLRKL